MYGLITKKDAETLEATLDLVRTWFKEIRTLELGVREGRTSKGIINYFLERGELVKHTGIDNNRDGLSMSMDLRFTDIFTFIAGNTSEVYNQVPDNSQHFIFVDANHSYGSTMLDFLLYSDKVAQGGYIAFHDTGKHIKPFTDYQGMGSKDDPDMYISCRKAIKKLGLLDKHPEWLLIFDEADTNHHTGGITCFRRI